MRRKINDKEIIFFKTIIGFSIYFTWLLLLQMSPWQQSSLNALRKLLEKRKSLFKDETF